jgi:nitrous oxide reductase accessory protein NosL
MICGTAHRKSIVFYISFALAFLLCLSPAYAAGDIEEIPSCKYCGMDRQKFAHSRVLVTYDDGTKLGACSLHCAAVDMSVHIDKFPVSIEVGDMNTKELINAETAAWVIGGDKMGVMTKRAKWAFTSKTDAEKFIAAHGGKLATLDEAFKAAFEDMYDDLQMIRKKRKAKREKMKK